MSTVMDCDVSESRPVLGPAGNKTRSVTELRKPVAKCRSKVGKQEEVKKSLSSPMPVSVSVNLSVNCKGITPRQKDCKVLKVLKSNLSMNASCSSDASSDSSHSRMSVGRLSRRSVRTGKVENGVRTGAKVGKGESCLRGEKFENGGVETDSCSEVSSVDGLSGRKRCAWVTANTGIIRSDLSLFNMF